VEIDRRVTRRYESTDEDARLWLPGKGDLVRLRTGDIFERFLPASGRVREHFEVAHASIWAIGDASGLRGLGFVATSGGRADQTVPPGENKQGREQRELRVEQSEKITQFLHDALGELLGRAQQAGAVRVDLELRDLKTLLVGCQAMQRYSSDPESTHRLLAIVRDGLEPRPT
jgi:hypothetical protein